MQDLILKIQKGKLKLRPIRKADIQVFEMNQPSDGLISLEKQKESIRKQFKTK